MNKAYRDLIKKRRMTVVNRNGEEGITVGDRGITAEEIIYLKANKAELIEEIREMSAEEIAEDKAKEAATIDFYSSGWESHKIEIDTRYDIDEQLKKEADYYSNDCTLESLKNDYANAVQKIQQEKKRKQRLLQ